ncbi:hypothetical protein ACWCPQ_14670 [Nocardia sp. NPDC001965]
MTSPGQPAPDGAYVIGGGTYKYGQDLNQTIAYSMMTGGTAAKIGAAQGIHKTEVADRIDLTYAVALEAQGSADQAVTEAEAAANAAAVSQATAAALYNAATYWESEFVAASAAVVLGVNELLIGLCQNVPLGLERRVTDLHVAFLTQPGGLTFELKKMNAAGTSSEVLDTYTLTSNQTRANWSNLDFEMFTRERLFINVTSVVGSVAPVVFQILAFGVLYDPALQPDD